MQILAEALNHADAWIDSASKLGQLIVLEGAVIGAIVGALTWIDRRIDTRIQPLRDEMREVIDALKHIRHHQKQIAKEVGVDYDEDD
jgi:hypothetical protein